MEKTRRDNKSQSEDIREDTVGGGKRQNALGLVVRSCDLCAYEAEAEGLLRVLDQPGLHSETLSQSSYSNQTKASTYTQNIGLGWGCGSVGRVFA